MISKISTFVTNHRTGLTATALTIVACASYLGLSPDSFADCVRGYVASYQPDWIQRVFDNARTIAE